MQRIAWHWIDRFSEQFDRCALRPGDSAVVLSETGSRQELVETARPNAGRQGGRGGEAAAGSNDHGRHISRRNPLDGRYG